MSIRSTLHLIAPALDALNLESLDGMQIVDPAHLAAQHHPPLNPDFPTLLPAAETPDFAAIQQVLLNQYPAEHPVRLVHTNENGASVNELPLSDLATAGQVPGEIAIAIPPLPQPSSFEQFQETIAHLRAPEGCPWDRKQTHTSLRPYLLEETYEVLDALDALENGADDTTALREELGDLLLQIVLHSQIAVDTGEFRMADIIATINEKIVRRHPHVWGTVEVDDEQDVKVNWDRLKQAEKTGERTSRLDGVPKALPALSLALSYQDRAARVKFDWATIEPVIAKVHEEIAELNAAKTDDEHAHEMGDLLFAVVNWARWLGVDPESALRATNTRFYRRFNHIEQQAAAQDREIDQLSLDEMDALWDDAKANGL